MPSVNDVTAGGFWPLTTQFNTAALSTSTATAAQLAGSSLVIMNNSGANPGTYTTRTAAQMIADVNMYNGMSYLILLVNGQGTGTLTLAGGANVTVSGTATVAAITARLFTVYVNSITTPLITITNVCSFTATALAFGA